MTDCGRVVCAARGLVFLETACTDDKREHYRNKDDIIEPGHQAGDRLNNMFCFLERGMRGISPLSRMFARFVHAVSPVAVDENRIHGFHAKR